MSRAAAAVLDLLGRRDERATVCPSEVARTLAAERGEADWRARMSEVHKAVDALVADGRVRLSWQGAAMPEREGPYRIGRTER
ncbi:MULTISPECIES: DUF3253 domain-containing protein [Sphingomonas]|uniref:DUF3253 domain-containing protein n=1 Tax=Sphingomonas TaxID=13687 RepID=UPI000DEF2AC4|nr:MULTISPECIES: DUF3253 domain-containing protein [Sphingomonas]